ncbi:MAG: hypothetical protein IH984_07510 [Planctomycetes bacterium]|nr:hypothetical protein [Planctomycetota bacterium]
MKRRLFKLVLFLLLGAVANVAVAWGCALWSGTNPEQSISSNHVDLGFGPARVSNQVWKFHKSHLTSERSSVYEVFESGIDFGFEAYRIRSLESLESPDRQLVTNALHVGWPSASLAAYYTFYYRESDTDSGLDPIMEEQKSGILLIVGEDRWIPVRPLWPGFATNTILYAAILWTFILGPFSVRRMIRIKRGLCIKCGYDLRGTSGEDCPECGWGRGESLALGGGDA